MRVPQLQGKIAILGNLEPSKISTKPCCIAETATASLVFQKKDPPYFRRAGKLRLDMIDINVGLWQGGE